MWRAHGVQSAMNVDLYLNTTELEDGLPLWNRRLKEWPPDHPGWDYPLR